MALNTSTKRPMQTRNSRLRDPNMAYPSFGLEAGPPQRTSFGPVPTKLTAGVIRPAASWHWGAAPRF
jgi:hypothetical protein